MMLINENEEKKRSYLFEYFRYQLVPTRIRQLTIDDVPYTTEKIREMKNQFFSDVISKITLMHNNKPLHTKIMFEENEKYLLLVGNDRKVPYVEEFETKKINSAPYSVVAIDNNPDRQIMAIRNDRNAFSGADTLSRIIERALNEKLNYYNLEIHIEAISPKESFWSAISNSKEDVVKIKFEIIKPNMSNISSTLDQEMRGIIDDLNSHKSTLTFEATSNGYLENVTEANVKLNNIVDYATQGGGNASVKFGDKTTYNTKKSITKRSISFCSDITKAAVGAIGQFTIDAIKALDNLDD